MKELSALFGTGRAMMLLGVLLLYVASRAGAHTLAPHGSSPGRRALGNWIPIAAAAVVAIAMRRGDWALSIIYATSIGCLSLLLGSICMMSPNSEAPSPFRRLWVFALPVALLALLVGFAGDLNWRNAVILLIEGLALLFVWQEITAPRTAPVTSPKPTDGHPWASALRPLNTTLCVLLALIGAIAGNLGAQHISIDYPNLPSMTPIVSILAPILVLPMLTGAAALVRADRASEAVTSGIAVVLLNICLLLPVAALLWYPAQAVVADPLRAIHLDMNLFRQATPLPFAWITWRVDSVVLVVLSFALFPTALGRWTFGRAEGVTLIVLYGVYVLMETAATLRS